MKAFCKIFLDPLKWIWNVLNFTRRLVLNLLLILIIFCILILYFQTNNPINENKKGALFIDIIGIIVDKPSSSSKFKQLSRELIGSSSNKLQENSLFDIVYAIRKAKDDNNITGLVLYLKDFAGSDQTSLQYIGKALKEFKKTGKPIYSIGDNYSQAQYFLASYSNIIYLNPQGMVDLHGISTNNFYYKTFLKKLKINTHVFRVGNYKSAVEPVLRDNMSDEAKEDDKRWIQKLWRSYLNVISINRNIKIEEIFPNVKEILEKLKIVKGNTAEFALKNNLVDKIESNPEIEKEMIKIFGWNKNEKSFNKISIYNYQDKLKFSNKGEIAVIFANGVIINGPDKPGFSSGDFIAYQIKQARLDPNIKSLVVRINSPGGSVNASEIIRSELDATKNMGKPVVVSMGGIAASGGYWISTPANYIISNPDTLTGSIGIFGIINTIESTLESIGIYSDGVSTSPLANINIAKKLPSEFLEKMKLIIENGYYNFLSLVSKSRNKTIKEVDKIGQGHVWIGTDALKKGLVDKLGDFDDAIIKAAELSNLSDYDIKWNDPEPSIIDFIYKNTNLINIIKLYLNYIIPDIMEKNIFDQVKLKLFTNLTLNDPKNCYAICLSCYPKI
ncbi:sppA [Wigglesworthia glossinidia endosymbiont of Glossina brevipalpis]|uniref:SppA protein n=1 Tax=Wigglesworthia glossinidia brevipalpis TaxID=36870 RepID=Q8D394_WIGBR|nr:sppA [Wigglesworthia glossinidia endosymbiont of Glossina brevipalpis]